MLRRTHTTCLSKLRTAFPHHAPPQNRHISRRLRHFSTSSSYSAPPPPGSTTTQPTSTSTAAMINTLVPDLDAIGPRFDIDPSQLTILREPADFYTTLKSRILASKRHVFLATLYIGASEHDLISTIRLALRRNPQLTISFLTDALRGTREAPEKASCASLLAPLIAEFGAERVQVRMYHTPNLTGIRKKLIPKRINEGWGLQHMKLYGMDDEILMSGANLSEDYFTNRQDRYHLISSAEVTGFFREVHEQVCSLSFEILPSEKEAAGFTMEWPESNLAPSPLDDPKRFCAAAYQRLKKLSMRSPPASSAPLRISTSNTGKVSTTHLYPLLQLTPLMGPKPDISTELPFLTHILRSISKAPTRASWTFTAGYFNTTRQIQTLLLNSRPYRAKIITASPQANGFYRSPGVSGMLPDAYTRLARKFLASARSAGVDGDDAIALHEWRRGTTGEKGGWTYHAKGFWVSFLDPQSRSLSHSGRVAAGENGKAGEAVDDNGPSISIIGSSNYTKRSYSLDLEANVGIVTTDAGLRRRLREEEQWLGEWARKVSLEEFDSAERRVGWNVKVAMWIVRAVGGAL